LIAAALGAVGFLMIYAGSGETTVPKSSCISSKHSLWIGVVQGFCLPFRGFSRSGATISTGLLFGLPKKKVEEFSFALAVVLTPIVLIKEMSRLLHSPLLSNDVPFQALFFQSLVGMLFSFLAGLVALRWLSGWLEKGHWKFFGFYCLVAAGLIFTMNKFFL
jgi:undecaprenyl-diphosphatase